MEAKCDDDTATIVVAVVAGLEASAERGRAP